MTIRAVVFDYGEVLCLKPSQGYWDRYRDYLEVELAELQKHYWRLRNSIDSGAHDGRWYWREIAQSLAIELREEQITELLAYDNEQWTQLNIKVCEMARALRRAGLRTGVLSNIHVDIVAHMRKTMPLFHLCEPTSYFDELIFSCEEKLIKPDARIYEVCRRRMGFAAEEILFVDDKPENIEAARACGLQGLVFTDAASLARQMKELSLV